MEIKGYSLRDISKWQEEESKIKLPSLQRGFVWKPKQVEDLWDSIFRGYPIGAVLMSVDKNEERLLLDGQQRSTSIALGFFNPFDESVKREFLSLKNYLPSIWIDLQPEKKIQNRKFLFRVLTKSHPWGYQIENNFSALAMKDRRNAIDFFKPKQEETKSYIDFLSKNINPWDSYFPVPLSFVLDLETSPNWEDFKIKLKDKLKDLNIKTKHSQSQNVNYDDVKDENFELIFNGLQNVKNLTIPEIQVKAKVLKEDDDTLQNDNQDPTLFIRLNSAGTQISGEELIYSIYKATFPKSKDLVEEIGTSFIAPSKVINLFSRLAFCEVKNYANYVPAFNINSFRKELKNNEYHKKLDEFIGKGKAINLIETSIKIIKQNKDDFQILF